MDKNTGGALRVHTALQPDSKEFDIRQKTSDPPGGPRRKRRVKTRRASFSERLLRNTAVSCALLLGIMALKNIDTPFTNRITGAVRRAVNMNLEIHESIGRLSFVQKLMPESALVFFNMSPSSEAAVPASGEVLHAFSDAQPWTEIKTLDYAPIRAILPGRVAACVQTLEGDYTILITHEDGSEAVYAYVHETDVKTGDAVAASDEIGRSGAGGQARLYLEYRIDGSCADPKAHMKAG